VELKPKKLAVAKFGCALRIKALSAVEDVDVNTVPNLNVATRSGKAAPSVVPDVARYNVPLNPVLVRVEDELAPLPERVGVMLSTFSKGIYDYLFSTGTIFYACL